MKLVWSINKHDETTCKHTLPRKQDYLLLLMTSKTESTKKVPGSCSYNIHEKLESKIECTRKCHLTKIQIHHLVFTTKSMCKFWTRWRHLDVSIYCTVLLDTFHKYQKYKVHFLYITVNIPNVKKFRTKYTIFIYSTPIVSTCHILPPEIETTSVKVASDIYNWHNPSLISIKSSNSATYIFQWQ